MNIEETAQKYFNSGYNCAESVLLAVCDQMGYDSSEFRNCIPRMATGFGGGIARNGDVCGAASGAVMAIGLALGRDDSSQSREPCYPATDRFYNEFQQRFGHVTCRDLTGLDMKSEQDRKVYQNKVHHERCVPIVCWTAGRAAEIITEYSPGRFKAV
jgi:C_GCAxxG_C_C family probable redox protein